MSTVDVLAPIAGRRKVADQTMRALLTVGTAIALVPLVLVIYFLLKQGLGAWSADFFTKDPTGLQFGTDLGGIKSAILGTLEITLIASVVAIPLGIGVALYLVEYGKRSWFAQTVRYFVDVMTGVPSIVFGLFIYILLVVPNVISNGYTGWKGSIALALLMLPIVTRSAEVVLGLVPDALREAALALGTPRWKVVMRIVLPTALAGLVTGSLLAVARAMGETAPLIFTIFGVKATTFNPTQQMNALPILIYGDVSNANDKIVQQAWGAALTLVIIILLITLVARFVARRSRLA